MKFESMLRLLFDCTWTELSWRINP